MNINLQTPRPQTLRRTTAALICVLSLISLSWLAWPAQARKAASSAATPAGHAGKRWNADQAPPGLTAEDWQQIQQAVAAAGQPDNLRGSNTEGGDKFGYSVAISGDTVVVGAPYEDSSAAEVNGK